MARRPRQLSPARLIARKRSAAAASSRATGRLKVEAQGDPQAGAANGDDHRLRRLEQCCDRDAEQDKVADGVDRHSPPRQAGLDDGATIARSNGPATSQRIRRSVIILPSSRQRLGGRREQRQEVRREKSEEDQRADHSPAQDQHRDAPFRVNDPLQLAQKDRDEEPREVEQRQSHDDHPEDWQKATTPRRDADQAIDCELPSGGMPRIESEQTRRGRRSPAAAGRTRRPAAGNLRGRRLGGAQAEKEAGKGERVRDSTDHRADDRRGAAGEVDRPAGKTG